MSGGVKRGSIGHVFRGLTAWLSAIALAILLTPLGLGHAQDPDLSWPPQGWNATGPGGGNVGFIINDKFSLESNISVPLPGWQPSCTSMLDPACAGPARNHGWWITRAAPPCQDALRWEECIEGLTLTLPDGSSAESSFIGLAPDKRTFPADPDRGLPTGSAMSLWTDPTSSDGSTGYVIDLSGQMGGREGPFSFGTFAVQVYRYRVDPANPGHACIWRSDRECGYRIGFDEGTRLQVSVLMNEGQSGWLSGRLRDPSVTVSPVRRGLNRITVSALPVDLPMVAASIPNAQASREIVDYWRKTFTCEGPAPCNDGVMGVESDGPHSPDLLRLFTDAIGDTATRTLPTWSFASYSGVAAGSSCFARSDTLIGLVTTNSTVYSSQPPTFDGKSLSYYVASLHKLPTGEPLSGTYNLVVRSDVARCLYGFSKAPVKAEIQVLSEDGTEQVATTSMSESGGWLRLSAYGFHFSEPTISVKLTSTDKRLTITCKKGKQVKKVTGVKPKCPAGWTRIP
jgi:hypothetical protein